jgi:hypothetical protein
MGICSNKRTRPLLIFRSPELSGTWSTQSQIKLIIRNSAGDEGNKFIEK